MNLSDVKDKIIINTESFFKNSGFRIQKKNCEYTKKLKTFNHIFRIGAQKFGGLYMAAPSVFLGVPQINKLFNEALSRKLPVGGSTCGFGIDNEFRNKRGRYLIEDIQDVEEASLMLKKDFSEIAIPWFEKMNSMEAVDKFINNSEGGKFKFDSLDLACMGLISANLVNNPFFEKIFSDYYSICVELHGSKYAEPIKIVKKFLNK